jgi:hypothetical protein
MSRPPMLDYEKYLFHKVHNSLMKKLKSNIEKNNFLNTTDIYLCDRSFIAEMRVRGQGGGGMGPARLYCTCTAVFLGNLILSR